MKRPPFIGNYREMMGADDSFYEGSNELLSIGAPVGKLLGLKKIGIHVETIPPGRRTSWPHAESAEEEFAYVIEGKPHVWIDGERSKPENKIYYPLNPEANERRRKLGDFWEDHPVRPLGPHDGMPKVKK